MAEANRGRGALLLAFLALLAVWATTRLNTDSTTFAGMRQGGIALTPRQWRRVDAMARTQGCTAANAVGLFFATQTGNTEAVATAIGEATGLTPSDFDGEDFADLDGIIAGCPTWNTGADEYRSGTTWDDYLDTIKESDLSGKTVAIFGCGDSQGYGDNFCDGIEELHNTFKAAGAKMVGYVDASGYNFVESKSAPGGKFLGLATDQDNEDDQTDDRVAAWVEQIKSEGMPL